QLHAQCVCHRWQGWRWTRPVEVVDGTDLGSAHGGRPGGRGRAEPINQLWRATRNRRSDPRRRCGYLRASTPGADRGGAPGGASEGATPATVILILQETRGSCPNRGE